MKKKKVAVFAVLGLISLSTIALGTVVGSGGYLTNQVNAGIDRNSGLCCLRWTPDLTINEKGKTVNSTIETQYSNYEDGGLTSHVKLKIGGSMKTTRTPYKNGIGGFVHGLRSIKVTFENSHAGTVTKDNPESLLEPDNPWISPTISFQKTKVVLNVTNSDGTIIGLKQQEYEITSGQKIEFGTELTGGLPDSFEICYLGNEYEDYPEARLAISSVEVVCDMRESYIIKDIKNSKSKYSLYRASYENGAYVLGNEIKNGIGSYSKYNYRENEILALKCATANPKTDSYFNGNDVTFTNATKVHVEKFTNDQYETIFFKVGKGDVVITIKDVLPPIYEGKACVGDYSLYSFDDKKTINMNLGANGVATLNGVTFDSFEVDMNDANKFSFSKNYNKTEFLADNLVYLECDGSRYIGGKSDKYDVASTFLTFNNRYGLINIKSNDAGNVNKDFFFEYGGYLIIGEQGITLEYNTGNAKTADYLVVKETLPNGQTSNLKKVIRNSVETIEGTTNTVNQVRYNIKGTTIENVSRSFEAGTYSGDSGDLVLDGFGLATLNNVELNGTYKKTYVKTGVYDIDVAGRKFTINSNNKTYVEVIAKDPFIAGKEYRYVTTDGSLNVSFKDGMLIDNKNKLYAEDVSGDQSTPVKAKYSFTTNTIKATISGYPQSDIDLIDINYEFEFDIKNLDSIKVVKYSKFDLYGEPQETMFVQSGTLAKLFVEDPLNDGLDHRFTGGKCDVTLSKGCITDNNFIDNDNSTKIKMPYKVKESNNKILYSCSVKYNNYSNGAYYKHLSYATIYEASYVFEYDKNTNALRLIEYNVYGDGFGEQIASTDVYTCPLALAAAQ